MSPLTSPAVGRHWLVSLHFPRWGATLACLPSPAVALSLGEMKAFQGPVFEARARLENTPMHASLTVRKLIIMLIIKITAVVSIARCVADMGEHSALYEVNEQK